MSEENNWNYGNDEPNVNQGNPVSLEKSTTDGRQSWQKAGECLPVQI